MNDSDDRRRHARYETSIEVDYDAGDDNFLFAYVENISEMGIFIRTDEPLPVGSELTLRFKPTGSELELAGEVVWINPVREQGDNPNPGMGVRFRDLGAEQREQIVAIVRTVAYLQRDSQRAS